MSVRVTVTPAPVADPGPVANWNPQSLGLPRAAQATEVRAGRAWHVAGQAALQTLVGSQPEVLPTSVFPIVSWVRRLGVGSATARARTNCWVLVQSSHVAETVAGPAARPLASASASAHSWTISASVCTQRQPSAAENAWRIGTAARAVPCASVRAHVTRTDGQPLPDSTADATSTPRKATNTTSQVRPARQLLRRVRVLRTTSEAFVSGSGWGFRQAMASIMPTTRVSAGRPLVMARRPVWKTFMDPRPQASTTSCRTASCPWSDPSLMTVMPTYRYATGQPSSSRL